MLLSIVRMRKQAMVNEKVDGRALLSALQLARARHLVGRAARPSQAEKGGNLTMLDQ